MWSALTHNGTVTVKNPATGDHRTFRVKKQKDDANFMPGKRLVALLTGPDNRNNFTTFGIVGDRGIILWKKHRGDKFYQWAAGFLVDPSKWADKLELSVEGKCRLCNRKLTTPESIEEGIGPKCKLRIS